MRRSGYNVIKCNIDANLNANGKDSGIHKISLILTKKEIANIEIGNNAKKTENDGQIQEIKKDIASNYEIGEELIDIKIK